MPSEDKHLAIAKMRKSIKILNETYDHLGDLLDNARPSGRKPITTQMTRTHKELTAENIFLNHLEAAETEVAPPDANSYKELDMALAELAKLQEQTTTVKKALQIASAISNHTGANRAEVSKRTT